MLFRSVDKQECREEVRKELGLGQHDHMLLMVGSGFITKGLDRALIAIAALPATIKDKTRLCVIGEDNPRPFVKMVSKLGLVDNVTILRGREDVPRFLAAADLLVHPAYQENTGTVLLEALVMGLPVVATGICGYAQYIEEAGAGTVLAEPFDQQSFNQVVMNMLTSTEREAWERNGVAFGEWADIYSMPDRAADLICQRVSR